MILLATITYALLATLAVSIVWITASTIKMIVTDIKEGN